MLTGPVKIFAVRNVPRLNYVADLILNEILGLSWELVTDRRKIGKSPTINYSGQVLPGSFRISPVDLLFETDIQPQKIDISDWNGLPVFFSADEDSDLPFDIFAATFFLVTRYEEYLDFTPDEHGRFCGSNSLAYRSGFLDLPVINHWVKEFSRVLIRKYQSLSFRQNEFSSLVTIDVDEPFAYRGKNFMGNIKGLASDFMSREGNASRRMDCIRGREKDPFDVFDFLTENIRRNNAEAKFFFPVGDASDYDKNPSWKNEEYRQLLKKIGLLFSIGLHPSFRASTDLPTVIDEVTRLKKIVKQKVLFSRFHFLKINLPASYNNLFSTGIMEDYSMGFHDEPGFRAGIATPFRFYDVSRDVPTNLRIYPFQVMDVTLREYKKYDPQKSIEVIGKLIAETRRAGGLFISIWHNTTLLNTPELIDWREVFEFTIRKPE
jgi:hypothetical protein